MHVTSDECSVRLVHDCAGLYCLVTGTGGALCSNLGICLIAAPSFSWSYHATGRVLTVVGSSLLPVRRRGTHCRDMYVIFFTALLPLGLSWRHIFVFREPAVYTTKLMFTYLYWTWAIRLRPCLTSERQQSVSWATWALDRTQVLCVDCRISLRDETLTMQLVETRQWPTVLTWQTVMSHRRLHVDSRSARCSCRSHWLHVHATLATFR